MATKPSHHDAFFKNFLGDINVAQDFLQIHLPASLRQRCDFTTLNICPTTFVDDNFDHHVCDMLYSVKTTQGDGYIYCLIEHQSRPDKLMAFRMMRYSLAAMKQHLDQGFKQLPVVMPVLFYHGNRSYPYSTDWRDCFADTELARQIYGNPFSLVDVTVIPDEEIMAHRRVALLELLQKHIRQRDMLTLVDNISTLMNDWPLPPELNKSVMLYIAAAGETADTQKFMAKLSQQVMPNQEGIMTIGQQLAEEGRKEGHKEGRLEMLHEVVRELMNNGVPHNLIKLSTGLSDEYLKRLSH